MTEYKSEKEEGGCAYQGQKPVEGEGSFEEELGELEEQLQRTGDHERKVKELVEKSRRIRLLRQGVLY